MLNLLKYCLFKDAYKLRTLFSLSKNKSKRCNRAPKYLENLIDPVKRFIQLHTPVLDSSRVDEGTGIIERLIWYQIMHFITKFATITSMIVIMKDWLLKCRSKVQKFLITWHKLFPTNEKKNWNSKSSLFVLW